MFSPAHALDKEFQNLLHKVRKTLIGKWVRNTRDTGSVVDVFLATERGLILKVDFGDGGIKEVRPSDIEEY